jgi:hypothetical protein
MMYEEADLCRRVRNVGYKLYCVPQAKVWHDIVPTGHNDFKRRFHLQDDERAYYMGRNRVLFHRKHDPSWRLKVFLLVFLPLVTAYYLFRILISSFDCRIARAYSRGVVDGLERRITISKNNFPHML